MPGSIASSGVIVVDRTGVRSALVEKDTNKPSNLGGVECNEAHECAV